MVTFQNGSVDLYNMLRPRQPVAFTSRSIFFLHFLWGSIKGWCLSISSSHQTRLCRFLLDHMVNMKSNSSWVAADWITKKEKEKKLIRLQLLILYSRQCKYTFLRVGLISRNWLAGVGPFTLALHRISIFFLLDVSSRHVAGYTRTPSLDDAAIVSFSCLSLFSTSLIVTGVLWRHRENLGFS